MSISFYLHPDDQTKVFAVVGLGLIGQAISQQLSFHAAKFIEPLPQAFDWSDAQSLCRLIEQVTIAVSADKLEIVWCAGKAGFGSTEDEIALENAFFEQTIVTLLEKDSIHLCMNLISSAGGLYENSGHVVDAELLSPSRPYARAKLAQESLLKQLELDHRIYRASTVYGIGGNRVGLVSIMLRSSIERTPMIIFANQNTLRDYIFNTDLALTIVNDVIYGASFDTQILASGRPTSIHTLLNIVHKITGRRVVHTYRPDGSNDQDITFSSNVIYHPFDQPLKTTNLEQGIKILANQMFNNGC